MKQFIYVHQPHKGFYLDISQIQSIDVFENTTGEFADHQIYMEIGVISNAVFPLYFLDAGAVKDFMLRLCVDNIMIINEKNPNMEGTYEECG